MEDICLKLVRINKLNACFKIEKKITLSRIEIIRILRCKFLSPAASTVAISYVNVSYIKTETQMWYTLFIATGKYGGLPVSFM